jgi:hypothetical protein
VINIRVQDLVLRFYGSDHIGGETTHESKQEASLGRAGKTHRYIEIIAPDAEYLSYQPAFAILGLVALHFGDAAVGTVITNESRIFNNSLGVTERSVILQGLGSIIPSSVMQTFRLPITISYDTFQHLDQDLAGITQKGKAATSLNLALRWYEQALRSFSDTERLLSSIVGIEAVVTRVSKEEGFRSPIVDIARDPRIPELLGCLASQYGQSKVDRLLSRLVNVNPNIRDRFEHFCAVAGWSTDYVDKFVDISDVRNRLVHGSTSSVARSDAVHASNLLAEVLGAAMAWQTRRVKSATSDEKRRRSK